MIPPIIRHFTDDDLYKFTMCCAVIDNYPRAQVRYTFTDRNKLKYSSEFLAEFQNQLKHLEQLAITEAEIEFMRRRCSYIPEWFYDFLRGFRYDSRMICATLTPDNHLSVEFQGPWSHTILLEVKVLAIISELHYIMSGESTMINYDAYRLRSYNKAFRLSEAGCLFSDFGTRRRASFQAQDTCVRAMKQCASDHPELPGHLTGTSNVYLAMKHDLTPIGTMAHELICAIAGMYGPRMANHLAMEAWRRTYRGALGTFLYDTYGWRIFSLNFSEDYANMFKGLRVDSGDNVEQLNLIVEKYRSLGIDPRTKQVVFSNALSTDSAIELQSIAAPLCRPSFGIGTHFTNDFPGIKPLNIVIKLTAARITEQWFFCPTCKLSEDKGKHSGNTEVVNRFKAELNIQ